MAKSSPLNFIVIDSNVWISALVFGGNARAIFEYSIRNGVTISVSLEIINEVRRIVLKKFNSFKPDLEDFILALNPRLNYVTLGSVFVEICRDPNDNFVIETAVISESKHIVSGDKDLLSLKPYKGIKFVSPADFVEMIGISLV